ncbi:DNA helicase [Desulfobacter hydrogenophilus]|uniref:DNA helicase n=1 Tax=Desulfobacter hydrogenophilus TaxID=2291 RepID=A0A328FJ65_9BACT|nr:ATP-binding protein [Desulfobacter hydrogenophilus]NDY72235.1 AAA family ATPase [Desulfobacter hydrogenophilus]QBH12866.1 DNA helicase [Desulfobacter hydrogenophilus]RAM03850.1 DNA helicase [Desulfobacter hydrogenophilus]
MNPENNLILVKNKRTGQFQDKTSDIKSCCPNREKYIVTFEGNEQSYSYNKTNIIQLKDPAIIKGNNIHIEHKGSALYNVEKIYDFGLYAKILFSSNRTPYVVEKQSIEILESSLTNDKALSVFEYLKKLSQMVGLPCDGIQETQLERQYKNISFVDPRSTLALYLNPSVFQDTTDRLPDPVFPFGFNLSQKEATTKALNSPISVIEGPPGTGKTQTILNIIANAVMNKRSIAVVSYNNSATSNVFEKLEKYGVDFIAAPLGNNTNKTVFFDNQTGQYPSNIKSWELAPETYVNLYEKTLASGNRLEELLDAQNNMAKLKQKLNEINVEKHHFQDYLSQHDKIKPYKTYSSIQHSSDIYNLCKAFQKIIKKEGNPGILFKLKNLFKYGIYSFSFYKNPIDAIIAHLQGRFYELKEEEVQSDIKALQSILENSSFEKAVQESEKCSQQLFQAKLSKRYKEKTRQKFSIETAFWKDFDKFNKEYPVILSTTHSLRSCKNKPALFDYVIMDEASQIDIVTGALALSCARRAIIVGDLKQLPNVVDKNVKKETDAFFSKVDLSKYYNYASHSMLSSITGLFYEIPKTLLREHYRCHPKIIEFCNQKFYQGQLIILTSNNNTQKPLTIHKTVKGNHARGLLNQRQIDVIKEEILPDCNCTEQSIGIASPFRKQVEEINHQFSLEDNPALTVHKYQGREKDIIVLSTVLNEIKPFVNDPKKSDNSFVDDPNLLNVAVSRAVNKLVVVISDNEKNMFGNIGDLIRYVEYNNSTFGD